MKELVISSFVIPFYKASLGFFVLIFLLFGVFLEADQHVTLGIKLLHNHFALGLLITGFVVYSWFQIKYQFQLLNMVQYGIFQQLTLLQPSLFYRLQFTVWFSNHLLIIIYILFLSVLSYGLGLWAMIVGFWVLLLFLFMIYVNLIRHKLKNPYPEKTQGGLLQKMLGTHHAKIGYSYWFLIHLKESRPFLLLLTKLVALVILNLFFYAFYTGDYDLRWLQFGVLCSAYIHLPIWQEKKDFEQEKLSSFLNLPITIFQKSRFHSYSTLQILALELMFLLYQCFRMQDISAFASLLFLMFSLNLGVFSLVSFTKELSHLSRNAIITFFMLFIFVLFGVHGMIISLICLAFFFKSIHSSYRTGIN